MTVEQCSCGLLLRVAASGKHQRQLSEAETVLERLQNMVTKDVATTQIDENLCWKQAASARSKWTLLLKKGLWPQRKMRIVRSLGILFPKVKPWHFFLFMRLKRKKKKRLPLSKLTERSFSASLQRTMLAVPPCYRRYQWSATIWKSICNDGAAVSGGMEHPWGTPVTGRSTIAIDGQALVMALGRPSERKYSTTSQIDFLKLSLSVERTMTG